MSGFWRRMAAALLAGASMMSSALALEAPFDHYVFTPNRASADVAVIDTRDDRIVGRVRVGAVPHQVAVSESTGKMLATNTRDNTLSIVDLRTLKVQATLRLALEPEHMEISPGGTLAAVGNIRAGKVSLVDLEANREIARVDGLHEPHNMTFSPDGKLLYVGNLGANFISVIDVAAGRVINEITVGEGQELAALPGSDKEHQGVINVTRTPDRRLGFAAYGDGGSMAVIDLRTQRKLATLKTGEEPWRAYTTADGRYMILPNNGDETVSIFSTASPFREIARLRGAEDMTGVNTGWFETTAFIISRGDDKLKIIDLTKMRNVGEIRFAKGASPETGVVTPDGTKFYVTLSGRDEIAVIDVRARKIIKRIAHVGKEPWGAAMVGALNYCH